MNPTAEALVALILSGGQHHEWPLPSERPILDALNTWRAIRESDRDALKIAQGWPAKRADQFRVDPLGERIAEAWAHYLHGEDPTITAANDGDQANYVALIGNVNLPSELERAGGLCVSEGEIWARIYVDEQAAKHPLLEWVSRRVVLPLWSGPLLVGAAIVTELPPRPGDIKGAVPRHFELHTAGHIDNVLFVGKDTRVGTRVELDTHPRTAGLEEGWDTGLEGLAVERIPNKLRDNLTLGISDYAGIRDFLYDLNEAAAIGAINARLTARKRAIVQASAMNTNRGGDEAGLVPGELDLNKPKPTFDPAEDVFVDDPIDRELGRDSKDPIRILEYTFDAEALIAHKRDLVETALTRVGLTGQFVGNTAGDTGYAISGTALRLRLIPTDKTGRGKARYWQDAVPRIANNLARVDASVFGTSYADLASPPTYTRQPGLPVDNVEEASRHQTLVGAGIESVQTAIEELHPDWDETRVKEELDRLEDQPPPAGASGMFGGV